MPSKSLSRSSLLSFQKYSSLLAGNDPYIPFFSSYELIQSEILNDTEQSVTFDVSSLSNTYQHLHLRTVLRSNRNDTNSRSVIQFNSDSQTNYVNHYIGTQGTGTIFAGDSPFAHSNGVVNIDSVAGLTQTADVFGSAVVDIYDPFETTKYTAVRFFDGQVGTFTRVSLNSGLWKNTASLTSINVLDLYGSFVAGTRISLYGLKGA